LLGKLAITAAGAPVGNDFDTANNNVFAIGATQAAVAAQLSAEGIANAAASGKRVYVDGFTWWASAIESIVIGIGDDLQVADLTSLTSRKNGGGGSGATVRLRSGSSAGGLAMINTDIDQATAANTPRRVFPARPWVLDAGSGLYVQGQLVNTALSIDWEIRVY